MSSDPQKLGGGGDLQVFLFNCEIILLEFLLH